MERFKVEFNATHQSFELDFGVVQEIETKDIDVYEGDYEVTPKTTTQSLRTKDKKMLKDVTVNEIPFHKVGNESGDTVYIGSEVRDGN